MRNAVARFDQVIDVSDTDRALAFGNIVNLAETSWRELGIHPQKNKKDAAAKGRMTRKRRVRVENSPVRESVRQKK